MKTGTSMSGIIDTRKSKKNRTMLKCNCSICVNKEKNGCRFGWEPINGKCNRFGTNHYTLSKEEAAQAREQTIKNKEQIKRDNEIRYTTIKKLSEVLDSQLTIQKIKECSRSKNFGNGKFSIKCTNTLDMIITIKFKDGKMRRYKILDIED